MAIYGFNEDKSKANILNAVYPVGAIYMSVNDINPSTLFDGTWERIQDKFLLAAGSSYGAGSTGGEATHKLSQNEMPSHYHYEVIPNGLNGEIPSQNSFISHKLNTGSSGVTITLGAGQGSQPTGGRTSSTGGGAAHNNMPPYLAVYMWKRTA